MSLDTTTILNVVRSLIRGTNNGMIKWEPESAEGDVFRIGFRTGGVRLSRVVTYSGVVGASGPLLLELLDAGGRSIYQFRPETTEDTPLVEELFNLAHRQALNLDQAIGALLEEIRAQTEK